jgi:hypothetical protein
VGVARGFGAFDAVGVVVVALHVVSWGHVAHLVHGVVLHSKFGGLVLRLLRPGSVDGLRGLPRLVRHVVDGLVADLPRRLFDRVNRIDGFDFARLVHGHVRQTVDSFIAQRTIAGEEVDLGADRVGPGEGLGHVVVLLRGDVLHGPLPEQLVLARIDGTRGQHLVGQVRHVVDGVVRHLALPHAQVVLREDRVRPVGLRRQVRLPVDRVLVHLRRRRHVLPLGGVRLGPRRLNVLALLAGLAGLAGRAGCHHRDAHVAAVARRLRRGRRTRIYLHFGHSVGQNRDATRSAAVRGAGHVGPDAAGGGGGVFAAGFAIHLAEFGYKHKMSEFFKWQASNRRLDPSRFYLDLSGSRK